MKIAKFSYSYFPIFQGEIPRDKKAMEAYNVIVM